MSRVQDDLRYKEFFESKLAIGLLNQGEHFNAVRSVSTIIYNLINQNINTVIAIIKSCPKMMDELREPYFGSLYDSKEVITPESVVEKILNTLLMEQSDLSKIMQLHCIFSYRLYGVINAHYIKPSCHSQFFRFAKSNTTMPTKKLGICNLPEYDGNIEYGQTNHIRAMPT